MHDPLAVYLHDHLAGASFAIKLLASLRDKHPDDPLGIFASGLAIEVEEDRAVLESLADRIGHESRLLKDAAGWVGEKASRVSLRHEEPDSLGAFEALEVLALGILGKRALWNALAIVAPADSRLAEMDFEGLAARAEDQHARVEAQRLRRAPDALAREPA